MGFFDDVGTGFGQVGNVFSGVGEGVMTTARTVNTLVKWAPYLIVAGLVLSAFSVLKPRDVQMVTVAAPPSVTPSG